MGRLFTNEICEICGKLDCENKKLQEIIADGRNKLKAFSYAISPRS